MRPEPCDQHNTWADFPGPSYVCQRCGWFEKAIEVRELDRLLDNPTKYASVPRPEALQSLWKREMLNPPDFQVQPVTVEEMERFLKERG